MSWRNSTQQGFVLPTVVLSSVVLLMVLVTTVSSIVSSRVALDVQFQDQLARDAIESGVAHASDCLASNNYVATWSSGSMLRPNTNCTGGAACTNAAKCFVVNTSRYATTYEVSTPADSGSGVQGFNVRATISLKRGSSSVVTKQVTRTSLVQVGAQVTSSSVAFGYTLSAGGGAFYATIGRDGTMRAAGFNGFGQLGNGTLTNTLTPTKFNAPTTNAIVAGYSNFLSAGTTMFARDNTGKVYGAGENDTGQIGAGSVSATISTPALVSIPGSRPISHVIPVAATTFFLATDGNLYAAGDCDVGRLGSNYTISGCLNRSTPIRVNLPTPNPSDPNTIPTTNIVGDRKNVYVRMAGGRVYGWGDNHLGQLGDATYNPSSNPRQIGTFGNANQPKAVQVETDGVNIFVIDSSGKLSSMGDNDYGSHGNRTVALYNPNINRCFNNTSGDGLNLAFAACSSTSLAQRFEYRDNGSLYNAATNKCIENTNGDGVNVRLANCTGAAAQTFSWDPGAHRLRHPSTSKCFNNNASDNVTIRLATCATTSDSQYLTMNTTWLAPFNAANISGSIISMSTDQRQISVVTSDGEVWSAGLNTSGMFGKGSASTMEFDPVKFQLPSGVYAKAVFSANASSPNDYKYQNLFVVGTNGRVYGAGSNTYGQLGNGTTASQQTTPVVMNLIDGVAVAAKEVQVGLGTAVIYTTSGIVYTVGNNANGQLGDGTTTNRSTPYFSRMINQADPTVY